MAAGQRVELRRKVPAVVEWFENRPNGLEHGFTLAERPAGNTDGQSLRVRLAVEGDLQPVVEAGGQKLALRNKAFLDRITVLFTFRLSQGNPSLRLYPRRPFSLRYFSCRL